MDAEGDKIRFLIANRPEWVAGALSEMGVDPFSAKHFAKKATEPQGREALAREVLEYMSATSESRSERMREAGRKRAKAAGAPRLPWDMNAPSSYEVPRGQ
jgi:hypothetical protein